MDKTLDQLVNEKVTQMLGAQQLQLASMAARIELLERDNADLKAKASSNGRIHSVAKPPHDGTVAQHA